MLKHINRMDMEGCLELQKKFNKDHIPGDHYHLKKQEPEKVTNLDISSFGKKSKKESSDLIKLATEKSDKRGLNCSFKGCNYIVTITNKGKAKKKLRKHEEETHKNIGKFIGTEVIETKITDKEHSNKNITNKGKQDIQGFITLSPEDSEVTYRTRTDDADTSSIETTSHEAQSESSHVKETQISARSLNHQLIQVKLTAQKMLGKDNFNWGLLKHDACEVEQLSHAPKADVEIPFQTEEDEKPQIKDKQGTMNNITGCPNGQWEGIIDHTGLKLASNIKCKLAKLQN